MSTIDPLGAQAARHAQLRQLGATLRDLAMHDAARGDDACARDAARALVRGFDAALRRHREDQEDHLFPALLESMAGSDPVCLRGITVALRDEHRALHLQWRPLRDLLDRAAEGHPVAWPRDAARDFAARLDRHLQREEAELLPMAARLLGDAELERLKHALNTRDARE